MIELRKEEYGVITAMLEQAEVPPLFAYSVIEQNQPGKVYVDRITAPACCLIIAPNGKYLVAGTGTDPLFTQAVITFLNNADLHDGFYDLYVSHPRWMERIIPELFARPAKLKRIRYERKIGLEEAPLRHDPSSLAEMDSILFTQYQTELNAGSLTPWKTPERFLAKGFGYCALVDGQLASASITAHRGAHFAEIDVSTLKPHRNQGFAQAVCTALLNRCKQDGLTPVWDCDADHLPSNRLAGKLGFKPQAAYETLRWHSDPKVMERYAAASNNPPA